MSVILLDILIACRLLILSWDFKRWEAHPVQFFHKIKYFPNIE